jgi:Flp pilus assembly protein protease CpaA
MLEDVLFGNMPLPGEGVRLVLAFLGMLATTYYDLFNNKNIPNNLLYAFLGLAIFANIIFFNQSLFLFGIATAVLIGLIGYILYKGGQMGAADIFVLASISLLIPIPPAISKIPFNFPFVAIVFVFASIIFAVYTFYYFLIRVFRNRHMKADLKPLILLLPYAIFVYVFFTSPFFSWIYFVIVSLALFSSIFVMVYKEAINKHLAEKIPVSKLQEEDVLAVELMDEKIVKKHNLQKLLTYKEILRLRHLKLGSVPVYTKFPPFLPFLLVGLIFSILFGGILFPSF